MAPPRVIDSAYNFVPLSRFILRPDWGAKASQDVPFGGGVSGRLKLTITAHAPILVAGDRTRNPNEIRQATFYRLRNGKYAIPGSAVRGMIRNVVEIAGFGAMGMVDDRRLGVRDLTPGARPFYGNELTKRGSGGAFVSLSRAGWLKLEEVGGKAEWRLTPCEYARVDHSDLETYRRGFKFNPGKRPPAHDIYGGWATAQGSLAAKMSVGPATNHPHSKGTVLHYRKATFGGSTDGTLVFTGAPSGKKHMEFFFFNRSKNAIPVPPSVMRAFHGIHETSEDWKEHWLPFVRRGDEVPVFWLDDGTGQPKKLGLAMMFRLAYDLSIGETIENTNPEHRDTPVLDLATLLFGYASRRSDKRGGDGEGGDPGSGLKGRVSFGLATAVGNPQPRRYTETVLNTPKPTYYPNYVRQPVAPADRGRLRGDGYATYTEQRAATAPELKHPEIRGWKRYPARPANLIPDPLPPPPAGARDAIKIVLNPLPEGTVFEGEVRFHNLRPEELGALLWALTWGGDSGLRHALGMGKPFGFGQISIAVDPVGWGDDVVPNRIDSKARSFDDYVKCFADYMDEQFRTAAAPGANAGWAESEQMVQLLAMANPNRTADFPGELHAMLLSKAGTNEFLRSKGNRKDGDPALVLAEYTAFKGKRDASLFPRSKSTLPSATADDRTPEKGQTANAAKTGASGGGFRAGDKVSVAGEFGTVVGFAADRVLVDFGDGPDPVEPGDVKRR